MKTIKNLLALFTLLLIGTIAFAQDSTGTGDGTVTDYIALFASPTGMVLLTMTVTGWISTKWPSIDGEFLMLHVKQWLAVGVCLVLCLVGYLMQLGLFVGLTLKQSMVNNGLVFAAIAAGIATTPLFQFLLQLIGAKKKEKGGV